MNSPVVGAGGREQWAEEEGRMEGGGEELLPGEEVLWWDGRWKGVAWCLWFRAQVPCPASHRCVLGESAHLRNEMECLLSRSV